MAGFLRPCTSTHGPATHASSFQFHQVQSSSLLQHMVRFWIYVSSLPDSRFLHFAPFAEHLAAIGNQ